MSRLTEKTAVLTGGATPHTQTNRAWLLFAEEAPFHDNYGFAWDIALLAEFTAVQSHEITTGNGRWQMSLRVSEMDPNCDG